MTSSSSSINQSAQYALPRGRASAPEILATVAENGIQLMAELQTTTLQVALQLNTEALEFGNQLLMPNRPFLFPFEWFTLAFDRYVSMQVGLVRLVTEQAKAMATFAYRFRQSFQRELKPADADPASLERAMDTVIGPEVVTGAEEDVERDSERSEKQAA